MTMLFGGPPPHGVDPDLDKVERRLLELDPTGERFATVIRDTLDQLYDGQHTGRWNFSQLHKTEKTHMGTLIEINLHREFGFDDGDATDYRIAGTEVDCKYSMKFGGWTLPPEVLGHLALVVTADDPKSSWQAGLVRVTADRMNLSRNRDMKGTLSTAGKEAIRWLWPANNALPRNLFLHLPPSTVEKIFASKAKRGDRHGQARTDQLFRLVQQQIVRRAELATVAQQDDFMKRARDNGGSRSNLRPEGILVLGHQENDPLVATALGIPVPAKGEHISVRISPHPRFQTFGQTAEINGRYWTVARVGDPVTEAPIIPK